MIFNSGFGRDVFTLVALLGCVAPAITPRHFQNSQWALGLREMGDADVRQLAEQDARTIRHFPGTQICDACSRAESP